MPASTFPGFDKLFDFHRFGNHEHFFGEVEGEFSLFELIRKERPVNETLQVHWSLGEPIPGRIATNTGSAIFFHTSVRMTFIERGLTGWTTYNIQLFDKYGYECIGYSGLTILGRCGPLDAGKSSPVPGQKPGRKFVQLLGSFFDEKTWDGSDFFMPGESGIIFVTERVKKLFEDLAIPNFRFTPLPETTWFP